MAKVRFLAHGRTWETDVPVGSTILAASKSAGAPEGDACGGVCAWSTCHVYVTKGRELLSEAEEDEEDMLDKAFDVRASSRLGCGARTTAAPPRTTSSTRATYYGGPGEEFVNSGNDPAVCQRRPARGDRVSASPALRAW